MKADHSSAAYPSQTESQFHLQQRNFLKLLALFIVSVNLLCCPLYIHKAYSATPVEQWKLAFDRARKRVQTNILKDMVDQNSGFAQMWFYGEVFSLATPAFPKVKRAELLSTLDLIARRLSENGEHRPLLLLETLQNQNKFTELSKQVNLLQDQLFGQANQLKQFENRVSVCIEWLGDDQISESTFYALLYRALLRTGAAGYMPNANEELSYLRAAQPLAECKIIFGDDITRWSVLKGYLSQNTQITDQNSQVTTSLSADTLREQTLTALWDQWQSKEWKAAHKNMKRVIDTLRSKGTRNTRLSLAVLLVSDSMLLAKMGKLNQAIQRLEMVIEQAFIELDQKFLQALLKLTLADFLTESNQWDQVNNQLSVMLTQPQIFTNSRVAQERLVLITKRLVKAIEDLHIAGRSREAVSIFEITLKLFEIITDETYSSLLLPQALRGRNLIDKRLARASFHALASKIYESLGLLEEAQRQLDTARKNHPQPEVARSQLLAWDLEKARLTLEGGKPQEALEQLLPLSEVLYKEQRISALATSSSIMGVAYHMLANEKAAFVFANYGLELLGQLKSQKGTESLHAKLHTQAAHALVALGYTDQAIIRFKKALSLEDNTQNHFKLAWIHNHLGHTDSALEAINLAKTLPLQKAIIRGCILAKSGRYQEALEFLQAYTLTSVPKASLEGRLCLLYASVMSNQRSDLSFLERPIPSLQKLVKDPRYVWRYKALQALKLAKKNKISAALQVATEALSQWRQLGIESPILGWHIESQVFALPSSPVTILNAIYNLSNKKRPTSQDQVIQNMELKLWIDALQLPFPTTQQELSSALDSHVNDLLQNKISSITKLSSLLSQTTQNPKQLKEAFQSVIDETEMDTELQKSLFVSPSSLQTVPGTLNIYLFEQALKIYRLTISESGSHTLTSLGSAKSLNRKLDQWRLALAQSPTLIEPPEGKRSPKKIKDPHLSLWQKSYQLARSILPKTLINQKSPKHKAIVFWSSLSKDYPWSALVTQKPTRYTNGEGPQFLANTIPIFSGVNTVRVASTLEGISRPKKGIKRLGPLSRLPCAKDQSTCVFNPSPLGLKLDEVSLNKADKLIPLNKANGLIWALPINRMSIEQWVKDGAERWGRLPSSPLESAASWIHFEQNILEHSLLTKPLSNLYSRGVESFSWPLWSIPEESLSRHLMTFERGRSIATAERFAQVEALSTKIDLSVGGIPRYHPYFWAHTYFIHSRSVILKSLKELLNKAPATSSLTQPNEIKDSPQPTQLPSVQKSKSNLADPFSDQVPQAEPPKAEPPKAEPPKAEPPKAEPPQAEPPQAEPPQAEPPQAEPPKAEPPKAGLDQVGLEDPFAEEDVTEVEPADTDTKSKAPTLIEPDFE